MMNKRKKETKKTDKQYKCTGMAGLSSREKNDFCAFMAAHGASYRTIMDRIQYRGFAMWELVGIANIMRNFTRGAEMRPSQFIREITKEERAQLYAVMAEHGMCTNTVRNRFHADKFRRWEMTGVDALFAEWQKRNENSGQS